MKKKFDIIIIFIILLLNLTSLKNIIASPLIYNKVASCQIPLCYYRGLASYKKESDMAKRKKEILKKCTGCKQEKNLTEFSKNKSQKDGYDCYCKECRRESSKKYSKTEKGKKAHNKSSKKYRETEKGGKTNRKSTNKYMKTEKGKKGRGDYLKSEKGEKARKKGYDKFYSKACNKLKRSLTTRVGGLLKRSETEYCLILLGCSIEEWKFFLGEGYKKRYKKEFDWSKLGKYKYEIDHIIDCCKFDLTKESEIKKCFNYKNTQLLSYEDHKKKHKGNGK